MCIHGIVGWCSRCRKEANAQIIDARRGRVMDHPESYGHWDRCHISDLLHERDALRAKLAAAHAEITEQARLLSMSAEREARLLAKLAEAERGRDEAQANYRFMVERAADEKLDGYRELGQRAADAENRADALQTFKAYVHARLDEAGVPVDPESPHKAAGCRIGGRLDWVFERVDRLEAAVREAPHGRGCPGNYSHAAPGWMRPGACNCWKRDALEGK